MSVGCMKGVLSVLLFTRQKPWGWCVEGVRVSSFHLYLIAINSYVQNAFYSNLLTFENGNTKAYK